MSANERILTTLVLGLALASFGCADSGDDPGPDVDSGMPPMDDGGMPDPDGGGDDAGPTGDPDPTCANLCELMMAGCASDPAGYANMSECMQWCDDIGAWEAGTVGDDSGNTIACRVHHANLLVPDCKAAGFTGGNVCGSWCENYCSNLNQTCRGSDSIYDSEAECRSTCMGLDDDGVAGTTGGDSIQCRIYHGGIPAFTMPETHCHHAGPDGLDDDGTPICAFNDLGYDFRMDAPSTYTRLDRIGMPAVSTALATNKSAYNDGDPTDDAALTFAGELIGNLSALHGALDDDIADIAGITACSMDPSDPSDSSSLPGCLAQEVAPGVPVVSLVVPDTITLDTSAAAGFPNGRTLEDPVMDVTLSVILLDLTVNDATTLVGTNPTANDVAFATEFPYLAPAH